MEKDNILCFRVWGRRALFTEPTSKIGGEKFSYHIPTPEALKGITESVFWKPTIKWIIRRFRVINPIQTEAVGVKPIKYTGGGNELSYYTYLKDVEYEIEISFEWNLNRPDLKNDRNENKYYFMAKRAIEKGGRRDIFLGTRECQAYVEPCIFGEKPGAYDDVDNLSFGLQFHSFSYPGESEIKEDKKFLIANFWNPVMEKGIVKVKKSEDCPIRRRIKEMDIKEFILGRNMKSIEEEVKEWDGLIV